MSEEGLTIFKRKGTTMTKENEVEFLIELIKKQDRERQEMSAKHALELINFFIQREES